MYDGRTYDIYPPSDVLSLQAQYEDEKHALSTMKKCFLVIAPLALLAVSLYTLSYLSHTSTEYPPDMLPYLLLLLPCMCIFASAWIGCIPAGFLYAWRSLRRSRFFVFGNALGMLLLVTLFACIPLGCAPLFFLLQVAKVGNLKSQLHVASQTDPSLLH